MLVGSGHVLVEDLGGNAGQGRVSNPSAVVASADLTELVVADIVHGLVIGLLVVLDGDLCGHATHGVDTTLVAGLDQQLDVGVHEGDGHGDAGAVRQNKVGVLAELLDGAENVVPAAAVETSAVVAQLVNDFVHFKGGEDGLNQDGTTDGATGHANVVLGEIEDVVPETGLKVALHLGEVEVRAEAATLGLGGIVEKVQAKVEQAARHGLTVDGNVLLVKVPATGTYNDGRQGAVGAELVFLLTLLEVDLAAVGVVEVDLTIDHVVPGGGRGV